MDSEHDAVIVRMTLGGLCGTNLHMFEERMVPENGSVLGYEPIGIVEKIGLNVRFIKDGQRVMMPDHPYFGVCGKCAEGKSAKC